jgi:hypothetical protein
MENLLNFTLIVIFFLGIFVNTLYLDQRNKKTNCYTNKPLIPWLYSETQGEWVSPPKPLSDEEKKGNVYIGNEEIQPTWKNFGENKLNIKY